MAIILYTSKLGMLVAMLMLPLIAYASNFNKSFHVTWGHDHAKILNNGKLINLSLDKLSGSGFESKGRYLFGKFDMKLKLNPGNSAGTVTTFFLSSNGEDHDEIDFEFLGNMSGHPYTVHTNVYSKGAGDREQQFHLWFDPTSDFHTYSITWNPYHIVFSVDNKPVREVKNNERIGVPYPMKKAMKIYASIWHAEEWATMGGQVKTDWSKAPFIASYQEFRIRACKWIPRKGSNCPTNVLSSGQVNSDRKYDWMSKDLDYMSKKRLKMVQSKYMIYDYCNDKKRFPHGYPLECHKSSV